MRQTISGLVAAIAVMTAGAAPAMACGGGLFGGGCSPCGQAYVSPCAQAYVPAPVFSGCNTGCGGWGFERLADPVDQYSPAEYPTQQYYYVNQGPTYTGPGNFAPYPTYREGGVTGWGGYHHYSHHYGYGGYGYHHPYHHSWHGHGYHYGYEPHHYGMHHSYYGYRERPLRRYY
jgi:hypothetical protein